MKTLHLSFRLSSLVLAALVAAPLAAQAQNIAIVNGKAVPKARVEALMSQALRQGNQQRTPELEQQVRDEVVLREMFMQEAEKRGLAASPDYKAFLKDSYADPNSFVGPDEADKFLKHEMDALAALVASVGK